MRKTSRSDVIDALARLSEAQAPAITPPRRVALEQRVMRRATESQVGGADAPYPLRRHPQRVPGSGRGTQRRGVVWAARAAVVVGAVGAATAFAWVGNHDESSAVLAAANRVTVEQPDGTVMPGVAGVELADGSIVTVEPSGSAGVGGVTYGAGLYRVEGGGLTPLDTSSSSTTASTIATTTTTTITRSESPASTTPTSSVPATASPTVTQPVAAPPAGSAPSIPAAPAPDPAEEVAGDRDDGVKGEQDTALHDHSKPAADDGSKPAKTHSKPSSKPHSTSKDEVKSPPSGDRGRDDSSTGGDRHDRPRDDRPDERSGDRDDGEDRRSDGRDGDAKGDSRGERP